MTSTAGRVGLLGGTFDPVHQGHMAAAEAARRALSLDRVLFVPSHQPPHRPAEPRASAFHRFAMVSLAVASRDEFAASDRELRRPGPSFTADTLRELHASGTDPRQIFFIIGTDAFAEIASWRDYPALLEGEDVGALRTTVLLRDEGGDESPSLIDIEALPHTLA